MLNDFWEDVVWFASIALILVAASNFFLAVLLAIAGVVAMAALFLLRALLRAFFRFLFGVGQVPRVDPPYVAPGLRGSRPLCNPEDGL